MTHARPRPPLRLLVPLALGAIASGCASRSSLPLPSLVLGFVATPRSERADGTKTPTGLSGLVSLVFQPPTIAAATSGAEGPLDEATASSERPTTGGSRDATLRALERRAVAEALARLSPRGQGAGAR